MQADPTIESFRSIALSTPEILHLILAELPMRCLLTIAQRVCRGWRDTINDSPTIQQQLFFRPIPDTTKRNPKYQLNPVLQEAFPPWFEPQRFPLQNFNAAAARVFDGLPVDLHRDAFLRKGASWRHMLVQQPPALELGILDIYRRFDTLERTKKWAYFEDDGGLRMGPLYDLVQAWVGTPKHFCQLVWWKLPPLKLSEDQETRDVVKDMLEEADVVLQRLLIGAAPMQPPPMNLEWKQKFRSEDYDVVDVISDEDEEGE
jgi:hypothetical protein